MSNTQTIYDNDITASDLGYMAYWQGVDSFNNPYEYDDRDGFQWDFGWHKAHDEDTAFEKDSDHEASKSETIA